MRNYVDYTILDAESTKDTVKAIRCEDFKHAVISIATDGGGDADLTVKIQGAINDGATEGSAPDFSAAQSATNMWDYIEVIDLEDGTAIDGDDGISFASADGYRQVEMNINALKYLSVRLTARTAGEVTVKVRLFTNN